MIWLYRLDPPADGAYQMQQDQTAYRDFQPGSDLPLLRFYSWSIPTLSVGRFQSLSEPLRERLQKLNIPVVRRPTGGQAILHAGDLTFSLVAPHSDPLKGSVVQSFAAFAEGVICGLQELGLKANLERPRSTSKLAKPAHCLEESSAADICLGGHKLVGAAQVRCRKNLLIQAVIYRQLNPSLMQAIFESPTPGTDLSTYLQPVPAAEVLAQQICRGFEKRWGIEFRPAAGAGGAPATAQGPAD